jgi:hypothetical protein
MTDPAADLRRQDALDTYEAASARVLASDATKEDVLEAFALVDALGDDALSAMLRRTATDWSDENPLNAASEGVEGDPGDSVAYDYEDEDGEED